MPGSTNYVGIFLYGSVAATAYALAADSTGGDLGLYISRPSGGTIHIKEAAGADQVQVLTGGTLQLNPTASTLIQALNTAQVITGSAATTQNYNIISFASDNAAITGAANFGVGLYINHAFGGAAMQGGRETLFANCNLNATTSASNANRNYVCITSNATTAASDGGTNTGAGALGALFSSNFQAILQTGATNWLELTGGEVNVGIQTGASAKIKYGWSIVTDSADAVRGATYDAALGISAKAGGTVGWLSAIEVSDSSGLWPVATTGKLFSTNGASAKTIDMGIDLSGIGTITTAAFKSKAFAVSGVGAISSGLAGTATGQLSLIGTTSGTAIIKPQDAAGTPILILGTSNGTPAVTASSPLAITTATGNITCATCLTTSSTLNLVVGTTTVTSGTPARILYDNAGVLGEYTLSGTGTVVVMATSPAITTAINPASDGGADLGTSILRWGSAFANTVTASGQAARTWSMAANVTASTAGQNLTLLAGGSGAGTDLAGGNLILSAGPGTGTGGAIATTYIAFYAPISGGTTGSGAAATAEMFRAFMGPASYGYICFRTTTCSTTTYAFAGNSADAGTYINGGTSIKLHVAGGQIATIDGSGYLSVATTDATSVSTGAIRNPGGMSVNKRVFMNGLSTDAGVTDRSVCQDNTSFEIKFGSGAAGICLGTSSGRYKDKIEPMGFGLAEIKLLQPKSFFYKKGYGDDGARQQFGFLAEDVFKVEPRWVGLDVQGRPNSVDWPWMIPAMVNAIKDIDARLGQLEKGRIK